MKKKTSFVISVALTMSVERLCRLKYDLLWVPINTFLFAQIPSILARSIVRCYLSNCEILMSMRQKLRKMLFFIFNFQNKEQILFFFSSRIRYGVFDVYNLKKIVKKDQILRLQMMNMCEVTLLLEQTLISNLLFLNYNFEFKLDFAKMNYNDGDSPKKD